MNVDFALNDSFIQGGKGAIEMAEKVVNIIDNKPSSHLQFTYELDDSILLKLEKVTSHIYGASAVELSNKAKKQLLKIEQLGYANLPICIAKTQYSFSEDAKQYGVAKDFTITIREFVINAGAGFIVAIAGEIMRMPGLPKNPQANHIDLVNGEIVGLS